MYCPSCGTQFAQALSYCNRCGANLGSLKAQGETKPPAKTVDTLVGAIVVSTIVVLGMALGALVLIKDGAIPPGLGSAFVIMCFFTLPVIEGFLISQLLRANRNIKEIRETTQGKEATTARLDDPPVRVLSAPGEPLPSVTEQTTRAFEPLYRDGEKR